MTLERDRPDVELDVAILRGEAKPRRSRVDSTPVRAGHRSFGRWQTRRSTICLSGAEVHECCAHAQSLAFEEQAGVPWTPDGSAVNDPSLSRMSTYCRRSALLSSVACQDLNGKNIPRPGLGAFAQVVACLLEGCWTALVAEWHLRLATRGVNQCRRACG